MNDVNHHIVLSPYSAVYVDIAKVASSSIKRVLAELLGLECPDENPHEAAFSYSEQSAIEQAADSRLFTFAFVRNPWDRLVSCYRDKIVGEVTDFTRFGASGVARCLERFDTFHAGMSFEDFVQAVAAIPDPDADEHFRSQADYLTDHDNRIIVDFIGRYENLQADFAKVARRLKLPIQVLPRLQSAPSRRYADFYDTNTQSLVAARYARDIALFNYSFSG